MSTNLHARIADIVDYDLVQTPSDVTYKILGDKKKSNIQIIKDYVQYLKTTDMHRDDIAKQYRELMRADRKGILEFYAM